MTSRSSERKAAAEEIVDGANEEDEIDEYEAMAVGGEKDPERGGGRREGSRARGEARRILSEAVRLGRKDASSRQYPDIRYFLKLSRCAAGRDSKRLS